MCLMWAAAAVRTVQSVSSRRWDKARRLLRRRASNELIRLMATKASSLDPLRRVLVMNTVQQTVGQWKRCTTRHWQQGVHQLDRNNEGPNLVSCQKRVWRLWYFLHQRNRTTRIMCCFTSADDDVGKHTAVFFLAVTCNRPLHILQSEINERQVTLEQSSFGKTQQAHFVPHHK